MYTDTQYTKCNNHNGASIGFCSNYIITKIYTSIKNLKLAVFR